MQRIYEPENLLEGQMLLDMLAQGQHLQVLFVHRHQHFGVAGAGDLEQHAARLHQVAGLGVAGEHGAGDFGADRGLGQLGTRRGQGGRGGDQSRYGSMDSGTSYYSDNQGSSSRENYRGGMGSQDYSQRGRSQYDDDSSRYETRRSDRYRDID